MRILLAALMCLVLSLSECFAISGGPIFGGGNVTTTGIYAGVLYPRARSNSIGLFSVPVPKTGLGSGTVFVFANQSAYNGTMQATADPDSGLFTGYIDSGFNFVDTVRTGADKDGNPTFTVIKVRAVASGRIDGKVKAKESVLSRASARLTGSSLLEFNPDFFGTGGITYDVIGFKQSEL